MAVPLMAAICRLIRINGGYSCSIVRMLVLLLLLVKYL